MSRRLVIDANIAKAASNSDHETASCCAAFLLGVREVRHHMVQTPDLIREWDKHQSVFSLTWRGTMESRGRVVWIDAGLRDLAPEIEAAAAVSDGRAAMLKDAHLVAAAIAADRVVASGDKKARALFARIAADVKDLGKVAWQTVDPDTANDALSWVRAGARVEPGLKLANFVNE
jgi:hypothetical protein